MLIKPQLRMYANPDYNIYLYGSIHFLSNLIVILNQFVNQKTKQNKTNDNINNPPPQKININKKQNNNNNNW